MSKELKKILASHDKKVAEARNALAKLFRMIVLKHEVGPEEWDARVMMYLRSPLSRTPKNAKDIGQDKNNLNRALAKDTITYNNFIKALLILRPIRIKITITMDWRNNKSTVHEAAFTNPVAELDEMEERNDSSAQ